jgi:hypothetical protein
MERDSIEDGRKIGVQSLGVCLSQNGFGLLDSI